MNPKKIISIILIQFISTILWTTTHAQYNPKLLIPYNQNGKWGWSDTLGNIKIKPKYARADFFVEYSKGECLSVMKDESNQMRFIKTNGEFLFPQKYTFSEFYWHNNSLDFIVIKNKTKYGLYSIKNHKILVPTKYDELIFKYIGDQKMVFFKNAKDATFSEFSDGKIIKTEYEKLNYNYEYNYEHFVFENTKKQKGAITKYGVKIYTDEYLAMLKKKEEEQVSISADNIPPPYEAMEVTIGDEYNRGNVHNFRTSYKNQNYEFKSLITKTKNGKYGVVNEKASEILPFQYDEIKFSNSGDYAILKKDGKYGIKIFFTHYPTIKPKYDAIVKSRNITVTDTWSFALMEVKIGEFKGYVGENGVEYFKK
ncbi:MAG: WG repeat-containing protein [Cytophagaceae bacterium]|nr:WG repeat-containing protein [Cytophagaceae bacterium]